MEIEYISNIYSNEEKRFFGFTISYTNGSFKNITKEFDNKNRIDTFCEIEQLRNQFKNNSGNNELQPIYTAHSEN